MSHRFRVKGLSLPDGSVDCLKDGLLIIPHMRRLYPLDVNAKEGSEPMLESFRRDRVTLKLKNPPRVIYPPKRHSSSSPCVNSCSYRAPEGEVMLGSGRNY
jgi:hypothetical protein